MDSEDRMRYRTRARGLEGQRQGAVVAAAVVETESPAAARKRLAFEGLPAGRGEPALQREAKERRRREGKRWCAAARRWAVSSPMSASITVAEAAGTEAHVEIASVVVCSQRKREGEAVAADGAQMQWPRRRS